MELAVPINFHRHFIIILWVHGVLVLDVGCGFRDRASILSECQIYRDVDLGQVNFAIASVAFS